MVARTLTDSAKSSSTKTVVTAVVVTGALGQAVAGREGLDGIRGVDLALNNGREVAGLRGGGGGQSGGGEENGEEGLGELHVDGLRGAFRMVWGLKSDVMLALGSILNLDDSVDESKTEENNAGFAASL